MVPIQARSMLAALLVSASRGQGGASTVDVTVNMSSAGRPFPHYWKRCFGSGHALLGTRADWQSHMQLAVAELGVQGVRMHGVLDDDMSVAKCTDPSPNASVGSGCYSFYNVDRVYDFLLSVGVRPIVELSFMPKALANCSYTCDPRAIKNGNCIVCTPKFGDGGSYKGLAQPPADFNDWYNLVHALATHMVERHGLAEVSTWHWEVWNEMWGMDGWDWYMPLFNASSRALKHVDRSLRVGGPSSAQTQYVQDLIAETARLNIDIDFISTHFYPSDPNCTSNKTEHVYNGISASDPDCFAKALNKAQSFAAEAGLPFLNTEYKDGLQGGNPVDGNPQTGLYVAQHGDLSYAAAFVMHNVPLLTNLDVWSYWTFTDVFEEGWGMSGPPFHGQYGCMTKEGIRKPVWRAFQALNQAGDMLLNVSVTSTVDPTAAAELPDVSPGTVTAFATTHADGSQAGLQGLQVFVTNFSPMLGATYSPRAVKAADISLTIETLPGQAIPRTGFLWRIDDNTTSARGLWEEMGRPHDPTPTQMALLHAASEMKAEELQINGDSKVYFSLSPYAVAILRFDDRQY